MNEDLDTDPELFATEPVPKRKPRTRRKAAPPVEEAVAECLPPPSFNDLQRAAERIIRENPLTAVALAVATGIVIGRFRR